jgi:hypothetical protein
MIELSILLKVVIGLIAITVLVKIRFRMKLQPNQECRTGCHPVRQPSSQRYPIWLSVQSKKT